MCVFIRLGQTVILIMRPEQIRERPVNILPVGIYLRVTHRAKTTQLLNEDNSPRQQQADL